MARALPSAEGLRRSVPSTNNIDTPEGDGSYFTWFNGAWIKGGFSKTRFVVEGKAPGIPCPDLNGDGEVNAADLAILLGAWGPCP